jgi:hypothetical protein
VAVVLLQLKLAIQRRALGRGGSAQRAWFVASWVLALVLGVAAGAVIETLASARDGLGDLGLVLLLSVVFLGWVLTPLLMPGLSDETVDPQRLEQFPISPRDQVLGLLLGSLVAPTALFTFLVAAGGTFASGEDAAARVLVLLAAALFTVLCVAAGRSIGALVAGAMRSRRARDVLVVVGGVIGISLYLLSRSAHNLTTVLVDLENNSVEQVLSWLPPGAAGQGMLAIRDGDWGAAALHLLVAVLGIAVALTAWRWAITRRVKGPSGPSAGRRPFAQTGGRDLELFPLPLAALAPAVATAAAAQHLRYYFFRQPQAIQNILLVPIMGAVVAHSVVTEAGLIGGIAVFAIMATQATSSNALGYDDQGYRYLLAAGAPLGPVLRGKVLGPAAVVVALTAVVAVIEAALNDLWGDLGAAILAGTQVTLVCAGIGALISVATPQNIIRRTGNKALTLLGVLAGLAAMFLVCGVLLAVWTLLKDSVNQVLLTLATLPLAAALGSALLRWAGRRLERDPWRVERILLKS